MKKVDNSINRPLTEKEKFKIKLLEEIGTTQFSLSSRIGPLTHIHAAGMAIFNELQIVIHHQENDDDIIYFAPTIDVCIELEKRGIDMEDWDV